MSETTIVTASVDGTPLSELVTRLLTEAQDDIPFDRRHHLRQPFFRPVTILNKDGNPCVNFAFTRDICQTGIGLLHDAPLPLDEVTVTIHCKNKTMVRLQAQIEWSRTSGDDWYLSGGRLLRADESREPA